MSVLAVALVFVAVLAGAVCTDRQPRFAVARAQIDTDCDRAGALTQAPPGARSAYAWSCATLTLRAAPHYKRHRVRLFSAPGDYTACILKSSARCRPSRRT